MTTSEPIFRLISADDNINLINYIGPMLEGWNPVFSPDKSVYTDSPLAHERRLIYRRRGTAIESVDIAVTNETQDKTIRDLRRVEALIETVKEYWTLPVSANISPIYIKAKSAFETNPRYALILDAQIAGHNNPFSQPFFSSGKSVLRNVTITIERGPWLSSPPGTADEYDLTARIGLGTHEFLGFTGNTTDKAACSASSLVTSGVLDGWTAEAWVRANGTFYRTLGWMFDVSNQSNQNWELYYDGRLRMLKGTVYMDTTDLYGYYYGYDRTGNTWNVFDGEWHHVTMMVTPITAGTDTKIVILVDGHYQDPVADNSSVATSDYTEDATNQLVIGNRLSGNFSHSLDYAWARISNTVRYPGGLLGDGFDLATSEVYNYRCSPPDIDGYTIAQWNIDEGSGATLDNAEGTAALDATITGSSWGTDASCSATDQVDVGVKSHIAIADSNVTIDHVYVYDHSGTSWTSNLIGTTTPYAIMPATRAVTDALLIGNSTGDGDGPFTNVVFNLGYEPRDDTTLLIRYWNGTTWNSFTTINDEIDGFSADGVVTLSWELDGNWAKGNLNTMEGGTAPSVTAWWVKIQVSSIAGGTAGEVKQYNNDIHTVAQASTRLASGQSLGDIGSLLKIVLGQKSGVYSRAVIGSKIANEQSAFQPTIHLTESVHSHDGISISYGSGHASVTADWWMTNERMAVTGGAGTTTTITLDSTIARDYAGSYRAFLICASDASTTTNPTYKLEYVINNVDTDILAAENVQSSHAFNLVTAYYEILSMGSVNILEDPDDLYKLQFKLTITWTNGSTYVYALMLIPTDGELFAELFDPSGGGTLNPGHDPGGTPSYDPLVHELIVDNTTNPRKGSYTIIQNEAGDTLGSWLISSPNGLYIGDEERELYFVLYNEDSYLIGANTHYDTRTLFNSVNISGSAMYRLMRGTT